MPIQKSLETYWMYLVYIYIYIYIYILVNISEISCYHSVHIADCYTHLGCLQCISPCILKPFFGCLLSYSVTFMKIRNLTLHLNYDRVNSSADYAFADISHQLLQFAFFIAIETRTRDWIHNLQVTVCFDSWLDFLTFSVTYPTQVKYPCWLLPGSCEFNTWYCRGDCERIYLYFYGIYLYSPTIFMLSFVYLE